MNWLIYINLVVFLSTIVIYPLYKLSLVYTNLISPIKLNYSIRLFVFSLIIFPVILNFSSITKKEAGTVFVSSKVSHSNPLGVKIESNNIKNEVISINSDRKVFTYTNIFLVIWLLGLLIGIAGFVKNRSSLNKIINQSYLFKSYGKVRVLISDNTRIPFAFRGIKLSYVILPSYLLENQNSLKIALKHELQHHRHLDTIWIHFIHLFKIIFFWNPSIYLLEYLTNEIQELACDEALIGHKECSFQIYGNCLLEVASKNLETYQIPLGTIGMAMSSSGLKLKQRIENMKRYHYKESKLTKGFVLTLMMIISSLISYGASSYLGGNKIKKIDAQKLVGKVKMTTNFPVDLNQEVLNQLNYYIANPKGKSFIENALINKKQFDSIIEEKMDQYNMPEELFAVALIESGFRNLDQKHNRLKSAGVWQFIPSTARNFGLIVNENTDERLNVEKETDAAFRLLGSLNLRFRDWRLALLSYYAGETRIQRGINKLKTRDPWKLVEAGYSGKSSGDKKYLAKIMAGVIILKNPSLLD